MSQENTNQGQTKCKCGETAALFQLDIFGGVTAHCWECHSALGDESEIDQNFERDEANYFYGSTYTGHEGTSEDSTEQIALFRCV